MPIFVYTAANNRGEITNGELETADIKSVVDYLVSQDLMVISVKNKKNTANKLNISFFSGLNMQDKILLTKHLARIIKAGMTFKEGVEILLNDAEKATVKKILTEVKFNLEKGQPLSYTLKKYPQFFSTVFIALVEAGEMSGTLEKSLEQLGIQLAKEYELSRKIKGATIYPAVLIAASMAVVGILIIFVVPVLKKIFFKSGAAVPWSTKTIIFISDAVSQNLYLIAAFFASVVISLLYFKNSLYLRGKVSGLLLKIPIFSRLYKKIILARFSRTLGTLLASGINILPAIDISSEAVGVNIYQKAIKKIKEEISKGVSLGNALKQTGIFPYIMVNMVNVGEKTGRMDAILLELAVFYEEEVDNDLKNLLVLLEPAILLVMGLVVGGIVFLVITSIYQSVGSISQT